MSQSNGSKTQIARMTKSLLVASDQLLISGTRFLATWMIARFCGAEQLGYYALGFSVLVLIDLLLQAFVSAPYTVLCQRSVGHRIRHYTGDAILQAFAVGFLGSVVFAGIGVGGYLYESPILSRVMFILAATAWVSPVREFARRFCFATERWGIAFLLDLIFSLVQIVAMCLALKLGALDCVSAHAIGGLASVVALVAWFAFAKDLFRFGSRRYPVHLRMHWRFGRWVFVSQTTNQMNWNVVQWILAYSLSAEATGVFTGCLTIAFLSNPFVLGVANVIYPQLANKYSKEGDQSMCQHAVRACVAIAGVMVTFTLVLLLAGQQICDLLYNDAAFANSSILLAGLAAAVSLLAVTMPLDACLWARQRAKYSSVASVTGLITTSLAVVCLVHWGTTASAVGLLIGCAAEAAARIRLYGASRQQLVSENSVSLVAS